MQLRTLAIGILAGACICANAQQKAPIHGLVTMGELSMVHDQDDQPHDATLEATTHPGVYSAVVINAGWGHLEPARGTFDFSLIEDQLKSIRAYNAKYPKTPVVGKLRVFGGPNAPKWMMVMDGGPVNMMKKGRGQVTALYWSKHYQDAWRELQAKLAAQYDNNELIQEVAVSSCGSTADEPFVASILAENVAVLRAHGFTNEQMRACLMGAIDDYAPWKRVALDYPFNGMREIEDDGEITQSYDFPFQVMHAFRERYGARAVIANHGMAAEPEPPVAAIAGELKKLGPPMTFQTAHMNADFDPSVALAKQYGATEFEMWDTKDTGKGAKVSYEQVKAWTKLFPYTDMRATQK